MSQSPRFNRCPAPPAALIQVVEHFNILAFNGVYNCRIVHVTIMT
jgi:hypothetical protein